MNRQVLPLALLVACTMLITIDPARAEQPELKVEKAPTTNPWTHLKLNNKPGNFQFVIVSDRHGGGRRGVFEDAVRKINLLQPEFVISVGDLIQGYTQKHEEFSAQWDEFEAIVAKLEMPFFYVPGNHDLSNPAQVKEWKRRFGRTYYHFVYRDVLFLALNTEDPPQSHISDEQIAYVRKALADNKDVRWTLAFMHKPLWTLEDRNARTPAEEEPTGWLEIDAALRSDGRPYTVFAGHNHNYMKTIREDRQHIILSTTGGGSRLRGTHFGEFDHVAWMTMTDEGPIMANLMLDGIWDENVTTEKSRTLANALESAARVAAEPLYPEGDTFSSGIVPLRLTNSADIPLKISGRFRPSEQVRPDPHALEKVLEPNSVEIVELKIDAREPLAVGAVHPLVLDLSLVYEVPQGPALEMNRAISVAVDRVLPAPRRTEPVVIDGKLDDWKDLPYAPGPSARLQGDTSTWQGPDDATFRFATAYDDQYVYIAIDSIDEKVMPPGEPDRSWNQDSVEVRLDARPDPVRSQNRGLNEIEDFVFICVGPGREPGTIYLHPPRRRLPEGTKAMSIKTDKGFATEIAIPVRYLNESQRREWKQFRLNIFQNDRDEPVGPHAQIDWRPDWRSDESYAGSGTFERE